MSGRSATSATNFSRTVTSQDSAQASVSPRVASSLAKALPTVTSGAHGKDHGRAASKSDNKHGEALREWSKHGLDGRLGCRVHGWFFAHHGRRRAPPCGECNEYHMLATVGMRPHALPKEPVVMADEILTVSEVAVLLKVAEKTVYTMAQKSELPCFKVRGQWRFRRQDLDSWMASQVKHPGMSEHPATNPKTPARKGGRG